jgi:integrase
MPSQDMQPYDTPDMTLEQVGAIADMHKKQSVLSDYQKRLAPHTSRRQLDDLSLFARYLRVIHVSVTGKELMTNLAAWKGVTSGLVKGFLGFQEREGYAIGSINVRLATVKQYCKLAFQAEVIDETAYALIHAVAGYRDNEGRNIDKERAVTRRGYKKAEPVTISQPQAALLKQQPDTPQGRRDTLLMCLVLDHGLRCGEIASLTFKNINLHEETIKFYREKVNLTQTHEMTKDTRTAMRRYLECVSLKPDDTLLVGSRKSKQGKKLEGKMTTRAITGRVNTLGKRVGIDCLSAHDGRHAWATFAIKAGSDVKALQDAGGWKSPGRALKYATSGKIANAGIKLD